MPFLGLAWLWVRSNWQLVLISIVIASIMGYIGILKLELNHANAKVANLTAQNVSLVEQVKNWSEAYRTIAEKVDIQNKAIDDYKMAGEKAKKQAILALKNAQDDINHRQSIIDAILAGSRKNLTCASAITAAKNDLSGVHP